MDGIVQTMVQIDNDTEYSCWLRSFINIYQQLATDNLDLLREVYHKDINFIDPMHEINGYDDLMTYFESLYTNLISCEFSINEVIEGTNTAAVYWQMTYAHPKLNSGEVVKVTGHSHLKAADEKIIYHRDYLDIGAMLYEHIPLVGKVVKAIKKRATK